MSLRAGRAEISVGALELLVAVEGADPAVYDSVDQAYRAKCGRRYASIVESINTEDARASTVRLSPREESR